MKRTSISVFLLCLLLLTSCGDKKESAEQPLVVSGAKSAIFSINLITRGKEQRPSAPLGIFSSMYLSQGVFLPARSALQGIEAQRKIIAGQTTSTTDETFTLLREFGTVLQVNIIDEMNRSDNRTKTLDRYTQTLRNIGIIVERKINELRTQLSELKEQRKEQQKIVKGLERDLRKAMKEADYSTVGAKQPLLTAAEAQLTETESREKQTEDILERFEELLEIEMKRLNAIEQNREILIAGLKVIEVPGIEDLRILEPGSRRGRRGRNIFDI